MSEECSCVFKGGFREFRAGEDGGNFVNALFFREKGDVAVCSRFVLRLEDFVVVCACCGDLRKMRDANDLAMFRSEFHDFCHASRHLS